MSRLNAAETIITMELETAITPPSTAAISNPPSSGGIAGSAT